MAGANLSPICLLEVTAKNQMPHHVLKSAKPIFYGWRFFGTSADNLSEISHALCELVAPAKKICLHQIMENMKNLAKLRVAQWHVI